MQALAAELLVPGDNTFTLRVRRLYALQDAMDYMELASEAEMFRQLRVSFIGEEAVDDGGHAASLPPFWCYRQLKSWWMVG